METCFFCDIQQGRTPTIGGSIYEDDLVYAHHWDDGPDEKLHYSGHVVLETKRHTPDFANLTLAESQAIGLLITRLSRALKVCTGAEKVYVVFYGEVTPHLHVHLTARYPNTPPEYLRWNVEKWPGAPGGDADEIVDLSQRLSAFLRENPTYSDEDSVRTAPALASELVSPQEAYTGLNATLPPVIIDVRGPSEFAAGHVQGARNISFGQLARKLAQIPRDRQIVTYCNMHHRGESRGERGAALLREHGFQAQTLDGGYPAWQEAGLPVEGK